jgi:hypothetical protein
MSDVKKPLQSKTINTAILQLISAVILAALGFFQADDTSKLLSEVLGPEGVALSVAALMAIKSFWDIWVRFNTRQPIGPCSDVIKGMTK